MVINGAKVKINAQISNFDIKLFISFHLNGMENSTI